MRENHRHTPAAAKQQRVTSVPKHLSNDELVSLQGISTVKSYYNLTQPSCTPHLIAASAKARQNAVQGERATLTLANEFGNQPGDLTPTPRRKRRQNVLHLVCKIGQLEITMIPCMWTNERECLLNTLCLYGDEAQLPSKPMTTHGSSTAVYTL
jgi:hypothetical protein